ncbi:LysR substrate-binding domain-containing protein [Variovorax ureilyticus]|uniref:LysR substrate-binding domain-containing protein n=1 Tax=Variovorax ureilyticus TaxID=1836198 RepID=A0ABU8VB64_9BURK
MINSIDSHERVSSAALDYPSLRQLEIFRAVAESGSIRSAARRLGLTQPAVTHAVRELERGIGANLFARSVKGVAPTDIGAALLRRSHLLFNEVRRAQEEIAELRDGTGGRLSIAFSSTAAQLLPAALIDFRARRPGVALELQELTWPNADARWHGGDYDFAVISESGDPPQDGLEREVLLEHPLVVAARAGHPQARARSLSSLQHCLWLVPGYGLTLLQRLFAARRTAAPADVIACQSTHMALTLLYRTDALALLSSSVVSGHAMSSGLVRLSLAGPALASLRIALLVRDSQALTPAARVFIDCLRRAAKDAAQAQCPA